MRYLGMVLMIAVALAFRFRFVCDDAYISFRYARNLARGLGLRYNAATPFGPEPGVPVEGFSNLGWVLYAAMWEGLLLPPDVFLPLTSAALGALGVACVFLWGRRWLGLDELPALAAAALVGWCPIWGVWSTGGLATVPFALAVLWLFERVVLNPRASRFSLVLSGLSVMLLRIEGSVWVAALFGLGLTVGSTGQGSRRRRLESAAMLGVAFVVFMGARWAWFGTLVPHTAVVKVSWGPLRVERGIRYVGLVAFTFATPLVVLLTAPLWSLTRHGAALAVVLVGCVGFAIGAGGDFLPMGRLLVVAVPFAAWALALVVQALVDRGAARFAGALVVACLVAQALPAADLALLPEDVRFAMHVRHTDAQPTSEVRRWGRTRSNAEGFGVRGRAMREQSAPGDTVVAPAIGGLGYFSGRWIYDQHGLVTREVGVRSVTPEEAELRSPGHDKYVPASWFADERPTFLHTKVVYGERAPRKMREWVERWDVPIALQEAYVPDFVEIDVPGRPERHFLVVVRRLDIAWPPDRASGARDGVSGGAMAGEEAAVAWRTFFERTRRLASDL
jgi:arabinofuranosyltransferase